MNLNNLNLMKLLLCIISVTIMASCKKPHVELFNGKNLEGWNQKGGEAPFTVEEGEIVGRTVLNTSSSFLCTKEEYGDFILELEVRIDSGLNSGIQFRSLSSPDYMDGRVHGYQCEVDPSGRAWSGGIYDEARRGWMYPLTYNPDATSAFKVNNWNAYRIEAIGDSIKTFINGVPVANLRDELTSRGFIALQIHSIKNIRRKEGREVRWRNIRIITKNPGDYTIPTTAPEVSRLVNKLTEKEKAEGWELLFNGKTVEKWRGAHQEEFPEFGWNVADGALTTEETGGVESQHGGDIVTRDEYNKFRLSLEFMITKGANSGIRYYVTEQEQTQGSAIGLEYQILDNENHPDAKLGNHESSRTLGSLYDLISVNRVRSYSVGTWMWAMIISDGTTIEHYLNGFKVIEYNRASDAFKKLVEESKYRDSENFGQARQGHILFQNIGDKVSFRSIKIKK